MKSWRGKSFRKFFLKVKFKKFLRNRIGRLFSLTMKQTCVNLSCLLMESLCAVSSYRFIGLFQLCLNENRDHKWKHWCYLLLNFFSSLRNTLQRYKAKHKANLVCVVIGRVREPTNSESWWWILQSQNVSRKAWKVDKERIIVGEVDGSNIWPKN